VTDDAAQLKVAVVMATRDRPERLTRALAALRAQTLRSDAYEIVVVDDGSGPDTADVLHRFRECGDTPALEILREEASMGRAAARNRGWRAALAPLIAFTDDDCVATPGWLEALLAVAVANPGAIVQGPTRPDPQEWPRYGPFSHTLDNGSLSRGFETANILYPRAVLERVGGFDETAFAKWGGEDADLGWRAIEAGVPAVWAGAALVHHAVVDLGPIGKLRAAWRCDQAMLAFKRHAGLRDTRHMRLFWNRQHSWVARAALAALLPRRLWWLRWWLAAPYMVRLTERRSGPLLAPYLIVHDLVEVAACARGSLRYRVLVI
jgi:GT2 family glycosyltransferase